MNKTLEQVIKEDSEAHQKLLKEFKEDGFWEKAREAWGYSAKRPIASEAQPADSNAEKEPDEAGSVLKEEE